MQINNWAIMKTVPFSNNTENTIHIGSATIPAGETRDVDPSLLPNYQAEGVIDEDLVLDPIAELLKVNVKLVTAQLADMTDEQLAQAVALEQDGQNRKSLIEAMTAETLRRANEKSGA